MLPPLVSFVNKYKCQLKITAGGNSNATFKGIDVGSSARLWLWAAPSPEQLGIRPINSHLHCSRLPSCLFLMPESDSAKEKSSANMSPMGFSPVCIARLPEKIAASGQLEGTIPPYSPCNAKITV